MVGRNGFRYGLVIAMAFGAESAVAGPITFTGNVSAISVSPPRGSRPTRT